MAYKLAFHLKALKELDDVGRETQAQILKKLEKRLEDPQVKADALSGMKDCYKIKLRSVGYRLVYQVQDNTVTVYVLAVDKRDKMKAYKVASTRL